MYRLKEVFKKSKISFVVLFISGLLATLVFNYFKFDDTNILDLFLVIVIPIVLAQTVYRYLSK